MTLSPNNAQLSSTHSTSTAAAKCIDGNTEGPPCHSEPRGSYPWLAISFPEPVEVTRVVIYNRRDYGSRTKNLEVRLTDVLPTSEEARFTGGKLFGTFTGPGKDGEIIIIEGSVKKGRYVLIQNGFWILNFHEVKVFGYAPLTRRKRNANSPNVPPPPVRGLY